MTPRRGDVRTRMNVFFAMRTFFMVRSNERPTATQLQSRQPMLNFQSRHLLHALCCNLPRNLLYSLVPWWFIFCFLALVREFRDPIARRCAIPHGVGDPNHLYVAVRMNVMGRCEQTCWCGPNHLMVLRDFGMCNDYPDRIRINVLDPSDRVFANVISAG